VNPLDYMMIVCSKMFHSNEELQRNLNLTNAFHKEGEILSIIESEGLKFRNPDINFSQIQFGLNLSNDTK